jgi:hypothetical protein
MKTWPLTAIGVACTQKSGGLANNSLMRTGWDLLYPRPQSCSQTSLNRGDKPTCDFHTPHTVGQEKRNISIPEQIGIWE